MAVTEIVGLDVFVDRLCEALTEELPVESLASSEELVHPKDQSLAQRGPSGGSSEDLASDLVEFRPFAAEPPADEDSSLVGAS